MRSVAPESAGAAASQKSWSVVNLKPSAFRFTATTLQSCHTANAGRREGTEIHRLSRATASPSRAQNALSSGFQMSRMRPLRATAVVVVFITGPFFSKLQARALSPASCGLPSPTDCGLPSPTDRRGSRATGEHGYRAARSCAAWSPAKSWLDSLGEKRRSRLDAGQGRFERARLQ